MPYQTNLYKMTVHEGEEPVEVGDNNFFHLTDSACGERGFYRLLPSYYEDDVFFIQKNGSIYMPNMNNSQGETLPPNRYCVDVFVDEEMDHNFTALVCFHEEKKVVDPVYSFALIVFFVVGVSTCRYDHSIDISKGELLPNGVVIDNGVKYEPIIKS
ncbi:hypothetical protein FQR65_LT12137 [Abscondita terminalis]|nr:hypothetical protein FQR65_LT12137 [Abscondita terminalis]